MESQKIKENRKAKFLAKMENKNKVNKKETKKKDSTPSNTNPSSANNPISQKPDLPINQPTNSSFEQVNKNPNNIITNNIKNNPNLNTFINNINSFNKMINQNFEDNQKKNILNDNLNNNNNNNNSQTPSNNKGSPKINFNELLEKINQLDYMINFQNILKKILIIILSILHCLNFSSLENSFILKYTLVALEISSLFFNKYYNDQKKIIKNSIVKNNKDGQSIHQIEKISQFVMDNFGIFNLVFIIYNFIMDIFADISILFIINIVFFLMNTND